MADTDLIERLTLHAASWRRDDAFKARDPEAEAAIAEEAAAALSDQAARIAELIAADEVRVRDISRLTVERDEARAECEGLRAALEEIANPLDTMRRRAAETGRRLDGAIANTLANDANHLKQIALAALCQKETGDA
ncbi:MAG: hypothetical protein WA975_18035 [Mesorhizobium sp.]